MASNAIEDEARAFRARTNHALEGFSETELDALRLRSGLIDGVPRTIDETAAELNMTADEVRAVEMRLRERTRG